MTAALIGIGAAGCSAVVPLTQPTVAQVLENCDAYRGKTVRVAGFLGECAGYDCHMFANKTGMLAWERYIADISQPRGNRSNVSEPEVVMGVGYKDEAWDQKAASFQKSYVVVAGVIDSRSCDGRGGTDRSPGLIPSDIKSWTASQGAPAN